jgi:hypothetical protein
MIEQYSSYLVEKVNRTVSYLLFKKVIFPHFVIDLLSTK